MTRGRFSTPQQAPMFYGVVFDREDDDTFGVILRVRAGEREYDCRPCFVGAVGLQGRYDPVPDGAQVLVVLPNGSAQSALAIVGIPSEASPVPSDYDGAKTVSYGLVEHRAAEGATVGGVVVRPFLDDLSTFLASLQSGMDSLSDSLGAMAASATPTTPPVIPNPLGPLFADLTAATATAAAIATAAATLKAAVDTSKAGSGTAPHCSGVLRAQAGS